MKPIMCYDRDGVLVGEYDSLASAQKELNILSTNICKVLKGKHKTCGNYVFYYSDQNVTTDDVVKRFYRNDSKNKKVLKINKEGNIICTYNSLIECFNSQDDYLKYDAIKHQCTNKLKSKLEIKYIYERVFDMADLTLYFA
jgi:hypothetical protein